VTIYGRGFTSADTVEFNQEGKTYAGIYGPSLQSVTSNKIVFALSSLTVGNLQSGTYQISVIPTSNYGSNNGVSNSVNFTINSQVSPPTSCPTGWTCIPVQQPTTPSVSINGPEGLALTYNSAQQESALTATFNYSINGGNQGVNVYKNYSGGVSFIDQNGNASGNGVSQTQIITPLTKLNTTVDQYGQALYSIAPGQTAGFTLTTSVNPGQLFAGTYHASLTAISANNGNFLQLTAPANQTNAVTIVGELSPYISGIQGVTTPGQTLTLTGQRLTGSAVFIDNSTSTGALLSVSAGGTNASFVLPASITNGSHSLFVSNSYGKSNTIGFQVEVSTGTSSASVTVNGTPTLALTYNSAQQESALTASFNVSVSGGSQGVNIPNAPTVSFLNQNGTNSEVDINSTTLSPTSGSSGTRNVSTILNNYGQNMYVVPAGQTVSFTVSATVNPQQLFANTYHATLAFLGANETTVANNWFELQVPANQTNAVTVVGEIAPYITSVSPNPATVGQTVTITGQRLTASIYIDGQVLSNVPTNGNSNGTTLSFTLPSLSNGNHTISMNTSSGASNKVSFQVTGASSNQSPVISGVTAPTTLTVGQTGTWSINASDPQNGSLSYSINWGDQNITPSTQAHAQSTAATQTSTFTHSYANAGTYTVVITVTDSAGLTAQTSSTVNVGNSTSVVCPAGYTCAPAGSTLTCPAGYTCTNVTANCPTGYTCQTATAIVTPTTVTTPVQLGFSVSISGNGNGTVTFNGIPCSTGSCSTSFAAGSSVTLTETPASGYTFSGWSGGCSGTSSTCTVTMSQAQSITAKFAVTPTTVTTPAPPAPPAPPVVTAPLGSVTAQNHTQNPGTAQGLIWVTWPSQGSGYTYTVTASPSFPGGSETTSSTGVNMGCWGPNNSVCYNGGGPFPANGPYTFTVTATNANGTVTVGTSNAETVSPVSTQSASVWQSFLNLLGF
jgi:uncharacterized repeat protein (TIGR02543 family)